MKNKMYEELHQYKNVPVKIAALYLGVSEMYIRCGLRDGYLPFGNAVKRKNWTYNIPPMRLINYLRGETQ